MTTPINNAASDKKLVDALNSAIKDLLSERRTLAAIEPSPLQSALTNIKTVLERDGLAAHPQLRPIAQTMADIPSEKLSNDSFIAQQMRIAGNAEQTPWQKLVEGDKGSAPTQKAPQEARPIMRNHF
jgi:hypothetical protein